MSTSSLSLFCGLCLLVFLLLPTTVLSTTSARPNPAEVDGNLPPGSALLTGKMFSMDRNTRTRIRQKRQRQQQKAKQELQKKEQLQQQTGHTNTLLEDITEEELEMATYEDFLHSSRVSHQSFREYVSNLTFVNQSQPDRMLDPSHWQQLSLHDMERYLAIKEVSNSYKLKHWLQSQNIDVFGFFHVSTERPNWKDMLTEQLYLLDGRRKFPSALQHKLNDDSDYAWDRVHRYTSLLSMTKHLYINVVASEKHVFEDVKRHVELLHLRERNLVYLHFNFTLASTQTTPSPSSASSSFKAAAGNASDHHLRQVSRGQFATLSTMQYFCKRYVQFQDKREIHKRGISRMEKEFIQHNKFGGNVLFEKFTKVLSHPGNDSESVTQSRRFRRKLAKRTLVYYMNNELPLSEFKPGFLTIFSSSVYNAFVSEFPSICMRAVGLHEYATCGVELQRFATSTRQAERFKSNMWWSDCHHVSQLADLDDPWDTDASLAFVHQFHPKADTNHNFTQQCAYSTYQHHRPVSLQDTAHLQDTGVLMRISAIPDLWQQVMSSPLPTSALLPPPVATANTSDSTYNATTSTATSAGTEGAAAGSQQQQRVCGAMRHPSLYGVLLPPMSAQSATLLANHTSSATSKVAAARKSYEELSHVVQFYATTKTL